MTGDSQCVEKHYALGGLLDCILEALRASNKDPNALAPSDLLPVDAFHLRGREATVELAGLANPTPGQRVLDLGSGLGGSARYLATEWGCRVDGVDVTAEYVDVANELAKRVGLSERVRFSIADALALPFPDGCFDLVWTEHVQMNIADKARFYGEIRRVLKRGGRLAFHDVLLGNKGHPRYPVPWAADPEISFLSSAGQLRQCLREAGLLVRNWEDKTRQSLDWYASLTMQRGVAPPPPLGLHLLMGEDFDTKVRNLRANLREGRTIVVQGLAELG